MGKLGAQMPKTESDLIGMMNSFEDFFDGEVEEQSTIESLGHS